MKRKRSKTSSARTKSGIAGVIVAIRRKLGRTLMVMEGDDVMRDPFSCCLKAAIAKCLDFNDASHSKKDSPREGHLFVSGMRGICEDLIVLRFIAQFSGDQRKRYLIALLRKNFAEGIAAQVKFFRANNSIQPVVGQGMSDEKLIAIVAASKKELLAEAKQMGLKKIPTTADMARTVGLLATYDFIYFLTSNFVHFNPQALMRMGWGRLDDRSGEKRLKNVKFSTVHMGGYYRNLGKFYGTILLIGFAHLLKSIPQFKAINFDHELALIDGAIAGLDRWPEVITFEEMNIPRPLFFMFRAAREVMKSAGEPIGYGQILDELKFGASVSG